MGVEITIPDFEWSSFYYPEILEDLIQYTRVNVPEITDEDPHEPYIQLLRSFALTAHLNNVYLDLVAKEGFIDTASLRASVREHLALIDYKLKQASPASVDLVYQLSQVLTSTVQVVPVGAVAATVATNDSPAIDYELLSAYSVSRTDQLTAVFAFDASAPGYTDHTAEANTPAGSFTPGWSGGAAAGDVLYFGHDSVMWDKLTLVLASGGSGLGGVWEFYANNYQAARPTSVTLAGLTLVFDLTALLGTSSRAGGVVRVTNVDTGGYEDCTVDFSSSTNKITTTGFLGQVSPSVDASRYVVGSLWQPVGDLSDGSAGLTIPGTSDVAYTLPQTITDDWQKVAVNGVTAYWLRFRIISGGTNPSITQARIDLGKQYILVTGTQGDTRADNPLGSSTGLPSQVFQLSLGPVLDGSSLIVYVNESVEEAWTRVDNFLASNSADKHYTVDFDDAGLATITFGDGVNGKVPAAGTNNIRATYRTLADIDGNVGQNTITVNKSGIPYASQVANPRPAFGYTIREGTTPADLARAKVAGPASLRALNRAVTPDDIVELTLKFVASDGTRPFTRALAIEESYGPKTIEVCTVGAGGVAVSSSLRQELADYFNGVPALKKAGVLLANNQVVVTTFSAKSIDVTATVYGGNLSAIQAALAGILTPVGLNPDGATFSWEFGQEVPFSVINAAIQDTVPRPRKVSLTVPGTGGVALATRELPTLGTLSITVVP